LSTSAAAVSVPSEVPRLRAVLKARRRGLVDQKNEEEIPMAKTKRTFKPAGAAPGSRRRFLSGAAAMGGAATLASLSACGVGQDSKQAAVGTGGDSKDMPSITLKFQGGFPAKDPLFDVAQDFYRILSEVSGGRIKVDLLPAGAVVGAFDQADAVHKGILDGSHAVPAFWYGKDNALSLFGTGPALGQDANTVLAWMEYGGGKELYEEIYRDVLKLDVVGLMYGPMPTQPLGWFRKEVKSGEDVRGIKYRTVGLSIDVFKQMGAAVVALPGGEIVPALERGVIDAAEFNNPGSDQALGFPDVAKTCMVQSYHQPGEFFEVRPRVVFAWLCDGSGQDGGALFAQTATRFLFE